MKTDDMTGKKRGLCAALAAVCAAQALLVAGCAGPKARFAGNPFASAPWSPIDTSARAIPAAAIQEGQTIVAAWVDADVSSRNVAFSVVPGAFQAAADGVVRFAPCGERSVATSWAELKTVLDARPVEDGALGLFFTVGGRPAIVPKEEPSAAMRSFLRAFLNGLDSAGVRAVLLVADRFEVVEWALVAKSAPAPEPAPAAESVPVPEPAPAAIESVPEPAPSSRMEPVAELDRESRRYASPEPQSDPFSGRSDWEF